MVDEYYDDDVNASFEHDRERGEEEEDTPSPITDRFDQADNDLFEDVHYGDTEGASFDDAFLFDPIEYDPHQGGFGTNFSGETPSAETAKEDGSVDRLSNSSRPQHQPQNSYRSSDDNNDDTDGGEDTTLETSIETDVAGVELDLSSSRKRPRNNNNNETTAENDIGSVYRLSNSSRPQQQSQELHRYRDDNNDEYNVTKDTSLETNNEIDTVEVDQKLSSSRHGSRNNNSNETSTENDLIASFEAELSERSRRNAARSISDDEDDDGSSASESCSQSINIDENDLNSKPDFFEPLRPPQQRRLDSPSDNFFSLGSTASTGAPPQSPPFSSKTKELRKRLDAAARSVPVPPSDESSTEQPRRPVDDTSNTTPSITASAGNSSQKFSGGGLSTRSSAHNGNSSSQSSDNDDDNDTYHTDYSSSSEEEVSNDGASTEAVNEDSNGDNNEVRSSTSDYGYNSYDHDDNNNNDGESTEYEVYEDSFMSESPYIFTPTKDLISPGLSRSHAGSSSESPSNAEDLVKLQKVVTGDIPSSAEARIFEDDDDEDDDDENDCGENDTGTGTDLQYSITSNRSGTSLGNGSLSFSLDASLEDVRSQQYDVLATRREENNRKGDNINIDKSRSGIREVDNPIQKSSGVKSEVNSQPSNAIMTTDRTTTVLSAIQRPPISRRSLAFTSPFYSSSSSSKSYTERLAQMLSPISSDSTYSSSMRNSTDMRSHTVVDPEDSTITRSTDISSSSNEVRNDETLHSLLFADEDEDEDEDDSSYYSSDDARSDDQESQMVDTNLIQSSSGSPNSDDEEDLEDDLEDDGSDDSDDDGDDVEQVLSEGQDTLSETRQQLNSHDNYVESGRGSCYDTTEHHVSLDQSLTKCRNSDSDNHEKLTGSNKPHSGRSSSSVLSESLEPSIESSESNTVNRSSAAKDEDVGDIARNPPLEATNPSNHEHTSTPINSAEEFDNSGIIASSTFASDLMTEDDDIGDIARKILLKATGAPNLDQETSLANENNGTKEELSQHISNKESKRIGDDGSSGVSTFTSNHSSQDDDIGDIARKILLKAIEASKSIESRNKTFEEDKQELRDPEYTVNLDIESMDIDSMYGESVATPNKSDDVRTIARNLVNAALGISEEDFSDEVTNASDVLEEGIECGESVTTHSLSVRSDDIGDIARKIMQKAMETSILNGVSDGETLSSRENDTKVPFVKLDQKSGNDECEEPISTTASDNLSVIARNITKAAMDTSDKRSLIGEESEPNAQHIDSERIEEDKDYKESTSEKAIGYIDQETRPMKEQATVSEIDEFIVPHNSSSETEISKRYQESKEEDDNSLSSGEIRELDNLLDSQEKGEEMDESRLYELDLYDRWQNGENLTDNKIADLDNFKARRRIERKCRAELKDLKERIASGEDADHVRMQQLELLERERMGENLNIDEAKVLAEFRKEEGMTNNSGGLIQPIYDGEDLEIESSDHYTIHADVQSLKYQRSNREDHEISSTPDDLDDCSKRKSDEPLFPELLKAEDRSISKLESSDTNTIYDDVQNLKDQRTNEDLEISSTPDDLDEGSKRASDEPLFPEPLKADDNSTSRLESSDIKTLHDDVQNPKDQRSNKEDLEISPTPGDLDEGSNRKSDEPLFPETVKAEGNIISKLENSDTNTINDDVQNLKDQRSNEEGLQMSFSKTPPRVLAAMAIRGQEDVLNLREMATEDEDILSPQFEKEENSEDESEYSNLSAWELDELDDLIERQERGFDVPEDRLRNLELFDKWQNNEVLDENELEALQRFKKTRKKERAYGRELINLIESKERGHGIDFDRLSALELYARHHTGEELTKDELQILNEFERSEHNSVQRYASEGKGIDDKERDAHDSANKLTKDKLSIESSFHSHDEDSTIIMTPMLSSAISRQNPSDTDVPIVNDAFTFSIDSNPSATRPSYAEEGNLASEPSNGSQVGDTTNPMNAKPSSVAFCQEHSDTDTPTVNKRVTFSTDSNNSAARSSHSEDDEPSSSESSFDYQDGDSTILMTPKPSKIISQQWHPGTNDPTVDKNVTVSSDLNRFDARSSHTEEDDSSSSESSDDSQDGDSATSVNPKPSSVVSRQESCDTNAPTVDKNLAFITDSISSAAGSSHAKEDESSSSESISDSKDGDGAIFMNPKPGKQSFQQGPLDTVVPTMVENLTFPIDSNPSAARFSDAEEDKLSSSESSNDSQDGDSAIFMNSKPGKEVSCQEPSDTNVATIDKHVAFPTDPKPPVTRCSHTEDKTSSSESSFDSHDEESANPMTPKPSSEVRWQEPSVTDVPIVDENGSFSTNSYASAARSSHAEEVESSPSKSTFESQDRDSAIFMNPKPISEVPRQEPSDNNAPTVNEMIAFTTDSNPSAARSSHTEEDQSSSSESSDDSQDKDSANAMTPKLGKEDSHQEPSDTSIAPTVDKNVKSSSESSICTARSLHSEKDESSSSKSSFDSQDGDGAIFMNPKPVEDTFQQGPLDTVVPTMVENLTFPNDLNPSATRFSDAEEDESSSSESSNDSQDGDSAIFMNPKPGKEVSRQEPSDTNITTVDKYEAFPTDSNPSMTRYSHTEDKSSSSASSFDSHDGDSVVFMNPRPSSEVSRQEPSVTDAHTVDTNLAFSSDRNHFDDRFSHAEEDESLSSESPFDSSDGGTVNPPSINEVSRQEPSVTNAPTVDGNGSFSTDSYHSVARFSHAEEDELSSSESTFDSQDRDSAIFFNPKPISKVSRQEPSDNNAPTADEKISSITDSNPSEARSSHTEENKSSSESSDDSRDKDSVNFISPTATFFDNKSLTPMPCKVDINSNISSDTNPSVSRSSHAKEKHRIENINVIDLTISSDVPFMVDEVASASHDESFSSREPMLSIGDIDELNELLDREENGEVVDEDRIYELDLLSRWQIGETLDDDELVDFYEFKAKRNKQRESEDLSEEKPFDRGLAEKDKDYENQDIGTQNLRDAAPVEADHVKSSTDSNRGQYEKGKLTNSTQSNLSEGALAKAEINEDGRDKFTFLMNPGWAPPDSSYFDESLRSTSTTGYEDIINSNAPTVVKTQKNDKELERELPVQSLIEGNEGDSIGIQQEAIVREWAPPEVSFFRENALESSFEQNPQRDNKNISNARYPTSQENKIKLAEDETQNIEPEKRNRLEENILIKERKRMDPNESRLAMEILLTEQEMKIEAERKQLVTDASLDEKKILATQKMRKKLEKEAQLVEKSRVSKDDERKKVEVVDRKCLAEIERAAEEEKRIDREVETTKQNVDTAEISDELEAPSYTETSDSSASDCISLSKESELSIWEMDELNELLDREENGEGIDEDRIYELDLFSRHQVGEELDHEEMADLDEFRRRRRKHRLDTNQQTIQDRLPLHDYVTVGSSSRSSEATQKSEAQEPFLTDSKRNFTSPYLAEATKARSLQYSDKASDDSIEKFQKSQMDEEVIDEHTDLETTNQSTSVFKDESSFASSELMNSFSVTKDLNKSPSISPSRSDSSRSFSISIGSSMIESQSSKPKKVEAVKLNSRQPSPSSITSSRKREKQNSKFPRIKQNKEGHDSSSPSSSCMRLRKGYQGKLEKAEQFDGKEVHSKIESGNRSLSSSNGSSGLIGADSGDDSTSVFFSKKSVKPVEREIVATKNLEESPTKDHESLHSTTRSNKGQSKPIPPRSTSSIKLPNKAHERLGNAAKDMSQNDSKESNIDDKLSISMQSISSRGSRGSLDKQDSNSISSRSSLDKQDSNSISSRSSLDKRDSKSLKGSGRALDENDQMQVENNKKASTVSQRMETGSKSSRKSKSTKTQKYVSSTSTPRGKRSEQQNEVQQVERIRPCEAMEKAFHNLQVWDSLHEGSLQNSLKSTKQASALEDIEKGNSSWAPAFDWNPFSHIKQHSSESQRNKPDPPMVNVRPPQKSGKPQLREELPIGDSMYVNRTTDDSSVASNWGPPSLLKKERNRKYSYVHRKDRFEMRSECSSSPKEYEQKLPHTKRSIQPHHHTEQSIPYVVQKLHNLPVKSSYESPKRDPRDQCDVDGFKGFDPDLLLSSWGLPVLEKLTGENPTRSKDMKAIPRNVFTDTINVESKQGSSEVNQSLSVSAPTRHKAGLNKGRRVQAQNRRRSHSTSSSTSHAASLNKERRMQAQNRNQSYSASLSTSHATSLNEERQIQGQNRNQSYSTSSSTSHANSLTKERQMQAQNRNQSYSTSSSTSHAASHNEERRIERQNRNQSYSASSSTSRAASLIEENGSSPEFIVVEESIGGSLDASNDFDLEQGVPKLKVSREALEMSPNTFEDGNSGSSGGSSSSSSSCCGVGISVPLGQNPNEQAADTPQTDSVIDQSNNPKRRRRLILCSVIMCILLLLALIGGGAAFVILKGKGEKELTPSTPPFVTSLSLVPSQVPVLQTSLPTLSPISAEPNTTPPNPPSIVMPTSAPISGDGEGNIVDDNYLLNLIAANAPDGGVSLEDPASPQSAALSWLQDPINQKYSESQLLQRYALATLYFSTNPNKSSWKNDSLWLTDTDECDWHSTSESRDICTTTTITNSDGSTIVNSVYQNLDLRENGLNGKIPDELSLLTALRTIRFSKNELTGNIPPQVATLTRLEYLDLSSNRLVDDDVTNTVNEVQSGNDDEKDVYVDVTTMNADDDITTNIFSRRTTRREMDPTITTMTKMNGDNSRNSFLSGLQNMQSLIHLDIFDNSFQTTLPSDIWGMGSPLSSNLKVLNLGSNQFYGTLPTEIGFLTKLTGLSVFGNNLSGQLPDSIAQLSQLELLYVDSNEFRSSQQLPGVPQAICGLRPKPLREFWADCEQISCYCCTTCCTKELGCVNAKGN